MKAFHNDLKIKDKYLGRVIAHAEADQIIKGKYWEKGKGCAVGCTIHSEKHKRYEIELGIPEWLARVEDRLFEGMPDKDSKNWPEKFLAVIHPGADLERAKAPFFIYILNRVLKNFDNAKHPNVTASIREVIRLYETNGNVEDFKKARAAVYVADAAADADAAVAATAVAAADADAAAVYYAATAVYYAATAVYYAADAAAAYARKQACLEMSEELLIILAGIKE